MTHPTLPKKHGGVRPGAGRPAQKREPRLTFHVPHSLAATVIRLIAPTPWEPIPPALSIAEIWPVESTPARQTFPLVGSCVAAGFPSPADDYIEGRIDLNEHLIHNKTSTFIVQVRGHSMVRAGIFDGDKLIVDRSVEAKHDNIVVAIVNGELTVKRLFKQNDIVMLIADSPDFDPIVFQPGDELLIWGVAIHNLHKP